MASADSGCLPGLEEESMDESPELTPAELETVTTNERAGLVSQLACHFCGLEFDVKKTRSLRAHIEEVHVLGGAGYMCGMCCEEFTSRKAVETHMSTFHRTPKPLGCGICGETFRIKNLLLKHLDSHTQLEIDSNKVGLCYCGECFEFFDSVATLHSHTVVHKEQAVYVCGACGLQSQHRHIMVKHLECHVISNLLTAEDSSADTSFKRQPVTDIDFSRVQTNTELPNCVIDNEEDKTVVNVVKVKAEDDKMDENIIGCVKIDENNTDVVQNEVYGAAIQGVEADETTSDTGALEVRATTLGDNVNGDTPAIIADSSETTVINFEGNITMKVEDLAEEEDMSYKCGVCFATFSNLAEALGHAESHQDNEDVAPSDPVQEEMPEECLNLLVEDNPAVIAVGDAFVSEGQGIDEAKVEQTESLDVLQT